MDRFRIVGPDRGGGWTVVEMTPTLVGGVRPEPLGRHGSREEAEAARERAQAAWDRYLAERARERAGWQGGLAAMAAAGAEAIDGRRTRVRGGW